MRKQNIKRNVLCKFNTRELVEKGILDDEPFLTKFYSKDYSSFEEECQAVRDIEETRDNMGVFLTKNNLNSYLYKKFLEEHNINSFIKDRSNTNGVINAIVDNPTYEDKRIAFLKLLSKFPDETEFCSFYNFSKWNFKQYCNVFKISKEDIIAFKESNNNLSNEDYLQGGMKEVEKYFTTYTMSEPTAYVPFNELFKYLNSKANTNGIYLDKEIFISYLADIRGIDKENITDDFLVLNIDTLDNVYKNFLNDFYIKDRNSFVPINGVIYDFCTLYGLDETYYNVIRDLNEDKNKLYGYRSSSSTAELTSEDEEIEAAEPIGDDEDTDEIPPVISDNGSSSIENGVLKMTIEPPNKASLKELYYTYKYLNRNGIKFEITIKN
jgi:hypothetical protein